jgi:hypothetical protein
LVPDGESSNPQSSLTSTMRSVIQSAVDILSISELSGAKLDLKKSMQVGPA